MNRIDTLFKVYQGLDSLQSTTELVVCLHPDPRVVAFSVWEAKDNSTIDTATDTVTFSYTSKLQLVSIGEHYTKQQAIVMFNQLRPWLEEEVT